MRRHDFTRPAAGRFLTFAALLISLPILPAAAQPANNAPNNEEPKPPEVLTRVYDIRDLLLVPADYPLDSDVLPVTRTFGYAPKQGGSGNGPHRAPERGPTRTEQVDSLVRLLEETIAPDTLRDAGGTLGALKELSGSLIVTQTAANHAALVALLQQLRGQAHRMVRVRALWVLLTAAEVEAVAKPLTTPPPTTAAAPPDGRTKDHTDGQAGLRKDAKETKDPPSDNTDPALMVADLAAIEKLPGHPVRYRAQTLGFNGQMVHISSGHARTIIADQTPVVGSGILGYDPTVTIVQDGATLEVSPLLTPDGATAVVDLTSVVSEWGDVEQSRPMAVVTTQPVTGDSPAVLDKLNMQVHQMRTTAALPLGKPILVGGMTMGPIVRGRGKATATTRPAQQAEPVDEHRQLFLIVEVLASKPAS